MVYRPDLLNFSRQFDAPVFVGPDIAAIQETGEMHCGFLQPAHGNRLCPGPFQGAPAPDKSEVIGYSPVLCPAP